MKSDGPVWAKYELVRETDKALLVNVKGAQIWVPKSTVVDRDDDLIAIESWLAAKHGIDSEWR